MDHPLCPLCLRGCPCTRGGISRTLGRTTGFCHNRQKQLLPVFNPQQHEQPLQQHLPPVTPPQQRCTPVMSVPTRKRKAPRPKKKRSKKSRELPPPPIILEENEGECVIPRRGQVGVWPPGYKLELLESRMTQPFSLCPAADSPLSPVPETQLDLLGL